MSYVTLAKHVREVARPTEPRNRGWVRLSYWHKPSSSSCHIGNTLGDLAHTPASHGVTYVNDTVSALDRVAASQGGRPPQQKADDMSGKTTIQVLSEFSLEAEDRATFYAEELRRYCDGYAFEGADSYLRRLGADAQAEALAGRAGVN